MLKNILYVGSLLRDYALKECLLRKIHAIPILVLIALLQAASALSTSSTE